MKQRKLDHILINGRLNEYKTPTCLFQYMDFCLNLRVSKISLVGLILDDQNLNLMEKYGKFNELELNLCKFQSLEKTYKIESNHLVLDNFQLNVKVKFSTPHITIQNGWVDFGILKSFQNLETGNNPYKEKGIDIVFLIYNKYFSYIGLNDSKVAQESFHLLFYNHSFKRIDCLYLRRNYSPQIKYHLERNLGFINLENFNWNFEFDVHFIFKEN